MAERTTKIDDKIFILNALTRGQMKTLRKGGLMKTTDPEVLEPLMDQAIQMSIPDINPDDLPCFVAARLFRELMDLTFGGTAEKNSLACCAGPETVDTNVVRLAKESNAGSVETPAQS